jgi:hypothetical protein
MAHWSILVVFPYKQIKKLLIGAANSLFYQRFAHLRPLLSLASARAGGALGAYRVLPKRPAGANVFYRCFFACKYLLTCFKLTFGK